MKKRILSLLMALCLVIGVMPVMAGAVSAESFTDVSKDSWYYDYVDYVAKKGYFVGTSKTTFSPDQSMTRAMFVVVLARHDGVKVDNSKRSFSDVPAGAWYAGAVKWASENGIVNGYADGTFKPNQPVTRAQMCAFMDRYVNYYTAKHKVSVEKKGTSADLSDQSAVPAYAKTAVKNCQIYGLIKGYGDGTFRPQASSTRAHVAAVIYRLSFLASSAKPSSGGGGSSSTVNTYQMKVRISTPASGVALDLVADYNVTTAASGVKTGDTSVVELAKELVTGSNATALKNAINTRLTNNVLGKSRTVTVGGQKVTVSIGTDGSISGIASVPVASIVNSGSASGASLFAAEVTAEQIEALIAKLENSDGNVALNTTDINALNKVLEKLDGMDGNDILDYVNENGSEALKQAAAGLTAEAIEEARGTYTEQLQDIYDAATAPGNVPNEMGEIVVSVPEPVTMTVTVDVQAYLTKADNLHGNTAKKDQAIQNLADRLGVTTDRLNDAQVSAAVDAIYALSKPSNFVTTVATPKLKSAAQYYDILEDYVDAMCDLWTALGEDSSFYTTQLTRAQNQAAIRSYVDVRYPSTSAALADLMGTTDKITNSVTGNLLEVDMVVNATTYPDIANMLKNNLISMGYTGVAAQIHGTIPAFLSRYLGTYGLKVSVTEIPN